jgi:hypothetical protein
MASNEKDENKKKKMEKIEDQIKKSIEYAKKTKIEHQRFEDVQEPIRCSKCGKIVFRYTTIPFKNVVCSDCKIERMEKRESSKIKSLETKDLKPEDKTFLTGSKTTSETFEPKKSYEILRTKSGIKVRKKEIEEK